MSIAGSDSGVETVRGIARLASELGISTGTVSRALNGKPDVNEETRRRVLEAANRFDYVANQSARSLAKGATNAIGFMIESGANASNNNDNFFLGVFDGVQYVLDRHHLDLVVLPCQADADPTQYLRRMVGRRMVDGLIISATHRQDKRIDFLNGAKIPFVSLGRSDSPGDYPWIDLDFEGVASRAVDLLSEAGHKRIAVAVPTDDVNLGFLFMDGYRAALVRNGLTFDASLVVRAPSSEQGGYQIGHELIAMADRPTAVVLVYELMAIGLYNRMHEAGLRPGKDLAIVGFRESPQSRFLVPKLTCFRMSPRVLGSALAEALLASMPAYAPIYPQGPVRRVWPLELVQGESDRA